MKPIEHMPTMAALGLMPILANGDTLVPQGLQVVALFLQKDVSENRQGSATHNSHYVHHLILIHT